MYAMKHIPFLFFVLFCSASCVFAQIAPPVAPTTGTATDAFDAIFETLTGDGGAGSDVPSTETILQSTEAEMLERMQTAEVTEETVRSAIEGDLVTENVVSEVNKNAVEAVAETADTKILRYAPRIKLDFKTFPLRQISGRFTSRAGVLQEEWASDEWEQTNQSLTNSLVKRIQRRLEIDTVRFEFKERTAVLTGRVPTRRQRDLVGLMVRMEPGIDSVQNDIAVETRNLENATEDSSSPHKF